MDAIRFAYWLQGFFEILGEDTKLTEKQTKVIKEHLDLVFKHEAGVPNIPMTPVPGGNHEWVPRTANYWPSARCRRGTINSDSRGASLEVPPPCKGIAESGLVVS